MGGNFIEGANTEKAPLVSPEAAPDTVSNVINYLCVIERQLVNESLSFPFQSLSKRFPFKCFKTSSQSNSDGIITWRTGVNLPPSCHLKPKRNSMNFSKTS